MKIKQLLTKTLLVAAGLLWGGVNSVWADDVYTIVYGTPTYTGEVITGVTPQTDFTSDDGSITSDATFSDGNGNTASFPIEGSALITKPNFTHGFVAPVTKGTVHFEANYSTPTSNTQSDNAQAWKIIDSNGVVIFGSTDAGKSGSNGNFNFGFCNGASLGTAYFRLPRQTGNRVVLDINFSTRKVSYSILVSNSNSGNNRVTTQEGTYDLPEGVVDVAGISGSCAGNYTSLMDNVSFYNVYDDAVSLYDYTVNYKLGDNLVKTFSSSAAEGDVITAESVIDGTEEGYVGNHYLITGESAPTMTITTGTNVLDVPVRAPYTATLTVTKNINGEAQTPEVTNLVETDAKVCSWIYAYPMYVQKDGVYYIADVTSTFGESGNFTNGQSISKTVNYTTAAPDVVWFKDINAGSVSNVTYSGGGYTNINEELANVTVDAGVYEVIFNVVSRAGNGSNHRNEGVSVNGTNVANLTGNVNGIRSLTIAVASDGSTITAYGNGSSSYTDNLDYVLIKKLPASVSVTVTGEGEGMATYVNSLYNLDFSETGIKAYKVKVSKPAGVSIATCTRVNNVPAGTPVLLYKEGGASATEDIPVMAGAAAVTENDLVAGTGGAVATDQTISEVNYKNMVLSTGEDGVGFYFANGKTVAANRAYLHILTTLAPNPESPAPMLLQFDNENLTGIRSIENGKLTNVVYDLQGRKVANPTKGLYIVNGKKTIIK